MEWANRPHSRAEIPAATVATLTLLDELSAGNGQNRQIESAATQIENQDGQTLAELVVLRSIPIPLDIIFLGSIRVKCWESRQEAAQ